MPDIGEITIQIRASTEGVDTAAQQATATLKAFAATAEALGGKIKWNPAGDMLQNAPEKIKSVQDALKEAAPAFVGLGEAAKAAFEGMISAASSGIEASQRYASALAGADGVAAALKAALSPEELKDFDALGGLDAAVREALHAMAGAVEESSVREALAGLSESVAAASAGLLLNSEAISENWSAVFGEDSALMATLAAIPGITPEVAASIIELAFGLEGLGGSAEGAVAELEATSAAAREAASAAKIGSDGFDYMGSSAEKWRGQQDQLIKSAANLTQRYEEATRKQKVYSDGMAALQKAQQKGAKLTDIEAAAVEALRKELGKAGDSNEVLAEKTKRAASAAAADLSGIEAEAQSLTGDFFALQDSAEIRGDVQVDTSAAASALEGLLQIANTVASVLAALGVIDGSSSRGGGGGGGGGRDDAAAEAERARREALQRDYDLIAHKRHMNEITLEMELSMLQRIRREHQLTAEEIMDWEEKVYDVKQEIRARDAASLDAIGNALITALTARYQAMLDAETERLDTSRRAWEDWRDGSVKAIQDQIDALDALAKTEDREKQDQEELRKIAKLRQDIEFEQDEYNRMKLQQQLEQAMESREERLRRLALEDAKDALRAEMESIHERAEAEIAALDEEQRAIEAAYAEQMNASAIQAEAEQLLMESNQQELIALIGEYAPEYNALGQTLGERLLDGFMQQTANVVQWFENLNSQLHAIQEAAAAEAIAASGALYAAHAQNQSAAASQPPAATTVHQTVNFNEPVDSAGEAARRLQQVNEELGALLNG